jgi:hypothetical protein
MVEGSNQMYTTVVMTMAATTSHMKYILSCNMLEANPEDGENTDTRAVNTRDHL